MVKQKKTARKPRGFVFDPKPRKNVEDYGKFPIEPESHRGKCTHTVLATHEGGFDCADCGFFIAYIPEKERAQEILFREETVQHEPEKLPMPELPDNYNILELPRSIFDLSGENFLREMEFGESDKAKLIVFNNLLGKGYKIRGLQQTPNNTYLILFEKA